MAINAEVPQLDNVQSVRNLGTHVPKWDVFITSFFSHLREFYRRWGRKIVRPRVDGGHLVNKVF